jgi:uncharacterized membrane protein required for colicin V production
MDGFTIIDGVVALVIVLSALLAYSRGLVREGLAIAGWIVAGVLSPSSSRRRSNRWSRNCPWWAASSPTAASCR